MTHERLRRATAQLLKQEPSRELKVADITRLAEVSPSTFYIYFADVNEAVLAVLEDAHRSIPDFAGMVDAFRPETFRADVRAFVKAYVAYWDIHLAALRIGNLTADEGNERFRAARHVALSPLVEALTAKIAAYRGDRIGIDEVTVRALATLLVGSLGRLVTVAGIRSLDRGLTRARMVDAAVVLICDVLRPGAD